MTYDFSTRLDLLGSRMKELHDNTLTYTRDLTNITVTNFTPEKTDVDQLMALGIAIISEKWQDFIFDIADLSTLATSEPRNGDLITWGSLKFQVTVLADEVFKYTTSTRKRVRVHTKQVSV